MTGPYCPQRREARLARRPVCPLRVFWVYKLVADSGNVEIQRQRVSIVDTHEPVTAMPLSPSCLHMIDPHPCKNQIFLVGRHQGVRRFVSPGLHHIKSAVIVGRCIRKTYLDLVRFVSSESGDDYLPSASLLNGD